jgi:hypothetical protein
MEIIDGIRVFSNPHSFFKWLWDLEEDTVLDENGELWSGRKLVAKLKFYKKR